MKIQYNLPNVYTAPLGNRKVYLMPGINDVPDEKARVILKHPAVQDRIAKGIIQIIRQPSAETDRG